MSAQFTAGQRSMLPVNELLTTGGGIWIYPVQGPIIGAKTEAEAKRVADAVNKAWREAIAAEQRGEHLLPKPVALMERSEWVELGLDDNEDKKLIPQDFDPPEPGVYEVQWDSERSAILFCRWEGISPEFPYGWRAGGFPGEKPYLAIDHKQAQYRPFRWRGITEAEARNLGLAK